MKRLQAEDGYTLMEFAIAMAILLIVLVSVAGVVYAAQKSTHNLSDWGDRSEQLRLAMNLIGEDAMYGQWYDTPLYGATNKEATLRGYQLQLDTSGWDASWQGWPGYITQSQTLYIDYTIDPASANTANLTRHVYDSTGTVVSGKIYYKAYATQILVYNILPYSTTQGTYSSLVHVPDATGMTGRLQLTLYAERLGQTGGTQYAPAIVQFNLREPAQ